MTWLDQIKSRVAKATAGPWHRGKVLMTPATRKWSKEQWGFANEQEGRSVFAYFSIQDEGRSREQVCEARPTSPRNSDNIDFIAHSRQDIPRLLEVVVEQRDALLHSKSIHDDDKDGGYCSCANKDECCIWGTFLKEALKLTEGP